jgi:hypothetical protein
MPEELSEETLEYQKIARFAANMQNAIACKFRIPKHNVLISAEANHESGIIELKCMIYTKHKKNENNENNSE